MVLFIIFMLKSRYYSQDTFKSNNLKFSLTYHKLYYSLKFNLVQISYNIQVLDSNYNQILPSDLTLYYNLHILCFIIVNNTINIYSLAEISEDKYFRCIEFYKLNERIKIGFLTYQTNNYNSIEDSYLYYYVDITLFNNRYQCDDVFDSVKILNKYNIMVEKILNERKVAKNNRLKKLYISKPICTLKRNSINENNNWNFLNIFNKYFCFCIGNNCLKHIISKNCKYYFYLYLIDKNRNVYKKTDFLLMDFILKSYSSDDVYPVFKEMINKNLRAHYLTGKEEIYEKYCSTKKYCDTIIYVKGKNYKINDDFLERHLTLVLKLSKVISSVGVNITFINNIFYNIDYITYICVGHGISYFKYYLYNEYYGPQNFDKLLIPNSEKLISVVIKNGWKHKNLIKLNLPRWEKYNNINKSIIGKGNIKFNSIFIMFTWRELKTNRIISSDYIKNIVELLSDEILISNLSKHNISLYFTLHHKILEYKNKFQNIKNIIYIEENDVSECLSKTNLIVTDYSSIIFDMIYRRKPFIIYIPDANDPNIHNIYLDNCYKIIKKFRSNKFKFKNVYFDIKSTINKINYYIDNGFKLEKKIIKFYDQFNFKNEPIINKFINYVLK